jgi:hypothetical protein
MMSAWSPTSVNRALLSRGVALKPTRRDLARRDFLIGPQPGTTPDRTPASATISINNNTEGGEVGDKHRRYQTLPVIFG